MVRWCGSLTHVKHVEVTQLLLPIPATEHVQIAIRHQSCQKTERKGEQQKRGGGGGAPTTRGRDTSTTWCSGIVLVCVDPQSHPHKRQPTAQNSCNICVINRGQAEGAVGMALITGTPQCPSQNPICEKSTKRGHKSQATDQCCERCVARGCRRSPPRQPTSWSLQQRQQHVGMQRMRGGAKLPRGGQERKGADGP